MTERPVPDREVPEGYELVAVVDEDWRVASGKRCRRREGPEVGVRGSHARACGRPSVAELNRPARQHGRLLDNWWAYCASHLYGRWIEDGKIMHWILRELPGSTR